MFRRLNAWLQRRADTRLSTSHPRPPQDDDREGGAGVLVPAGPRPRIGGAQARPPGPDH